MHIKKYLSSYVPRAEKLLDTLLDREIKNYASRADPVCLRALDIFKSYAKGGKMLRGGLTLLGYRIGGGQNRKEALKASVAIEILHSFLLVHDDWMDQDSFRRGRPTIHVRYRKEKGSSHYGACMAVNIGDFAHSFAHKIIVDLDLDEKKKNRALSLLLRREINTVYGQLMDVSFDRQKTVSWDRITAVRRLKTAHYTFVMPLSVGFTLARGQNRNILRAIEAYGLPVGLAFQIRDDILGIFGNEKIFKKSTSSDLVSGTKSFLLAKALELVKGRDKTNFQKAFGNSGATSAEIDLARLAIRNSGALEFCQKEAAKLVKKGQKAIPRITGDPERREILSTLADYVLSRQK